MVNYVSTIRFSCLFFLCLQAFVDISKLESSSIVIEYNIDAEAIMNDNNVANQIDRLLDIGLEYQRATGKKFEYKDFLKKTYRYLDENNAHVPKEIRKDIKKRIKKRIKDRNFQVIGKGLAYNVSSDKNGSSNERYNDPRDKDYYDYTDSFRGAVGETCIGLAMCAVPCGATQAVGAVVAWHGFARVGEEWANYYYREPSYHEPSRAEIRAERRESSQGGRRYERDRD